MPTGAKCACTSDTGLALVKGLPVSGTSIEGSLNTASEVSDDDYFARCAGVFGPKG